MFKKTESKLPTSDVVLFIPFTVSENNFSLYIRALDWRNNLRSSEKMGTIIPRIVMYRHPDENEEDYELYDTADFKFTPQNLPANTVIYILADGTGDPDYVVNVNQTYYERLGQEPYQLSIDAVAWRMKQCGLTPVLARNLKAINLYVCDESMTNDRLATYFAQELGDEYKNLTVNYYSATVYIPRPIVTEQGEKRVKKTAYFNLELANGQTQLVMAGYAHEHKHSIKVIDVLALERSTNSSAESREAKAIPLPTFRELSHTSSSVSSASVPSASVFIEEIDDSGMMPIGWEQKAQTGKVTLPDDSTVHQADVSEVDISKLRLEASQSKYQIVKTNQCTTILIWQESTIFSFFKSAEKTNKKNEGILNHHSSNGIF
ncbi:hypothetical protein OQJ13_00740 [Legionella sp. PATHC035]|uniref:hypothetical protein n=1 Tax=Legionella sp. PATHC035 TaxID=2992040 RepID=UPI00224477BB|nr:hypothetical protein [Legionella sp. PATHC035]MCW8407498.1 hypothetical protein [Legionella sp. PATHC035]